MPAWIAIDVIHVSFVQKKAFHATASCQIPPASPKSKFPAYASFITFEAWIITK